MRVVRPVLFGLFLIASIFIPIARGQSGPVTPDLEEGMKPFGDFSGGDFDQVSLSSGKLVLNLPLICYPQRGGKIKLCFSIRYQNITPRQTEKYYPNTDTYVEQLFRDAASANNQGGGLKFVDNLGGWSAVGPGVNWSQVWSPDNDLHIMLYVSSTGNFESNDATGLSFNTPANTLMMPDGVRFTYSSTTGLSKVEDPNGNFVTPATNSSGAISAWTDTLGRSIATPLGATSTTDYSHCTGANPIGAASLWIVPGPNGGTETFKFCYAGYSYSFQSDIGGQLATASGALTMLQSIVLPNLTTWTFHYEPTYAALDQITLPTGGTIGYTWGLDYAPCRNSSTTDPRTQVVTTKWGWSVGVASRTVNANDGTGAKTWTYSGGTITDPLGNQSVHAITGLAGTGSLYETQAKYYQGSSTTGTLLKTVNTDYSWHFYPLGGVQTSCQNVISVVPIRVTTTWPNGQVTKLETDYDSGFTGTPTSSGGTSETAVYGQVVAKREYDYANGAPGPLLRQTKTTYVWQSNSSYLTNNLLAYPSSTQVLDGSSTQRAYTAYYYDQYSIASSGISTQHDSAPPNGSYRANRTSTARWLNGSTVSTTNCPISVSNGYLYSYDLYFDTGTVQKATDSCGSSAGDPNHTATYAYSSNYAGAWPTTITNPLGQSVSQAFDFNTGLRTSRTDPNNQTTSYQYNDSLGRLTEVDYPDGGITKSIYTDSALSSNVEVQRKIDSTRWTDSFVVYNGLVHPVVHSAANDEATPWDRTDTCFDTLGRPQLASYPYQSSNSTSAPNCSGTGDTFSYDALSRVTQLTHSDGSAVLTTYTGRATQVQDEGNGTHRVTHISQVDGLGRMASVCEVTSASQLGSSGSPAACGQDISGTGFLTTYGYDTLGNLTSSSQSGLNSRTFQYDSLSRLTSASNPESGTTNYACDADGNVITKTDARGITTTSSYDFLNRITQRSYSDGSTPTAYFTYDETQGWGNTLSNPVGRLTSVATWRGVGNWITASVLDYDPLGRPKDIWSCTPQNCGGAAWHTTYAYDLAGDIASSTNAAGVTFTDTVNRATRLTTLTSSLSDSNHPGTLFSSAHYNAAGAMLSASLSNVITETRTYDPRIRLASISDGSNYSLTIPSSGGYAPNSDILAANDSVNGNWTYSYDDFNRLSGSNQNSGQSVYSYAYDRFGNRWQQNGPYSMQLSFSGANNRMDSYSYDAAGNLLSDGSHSYSYDAENRITQVDGGSAGTYVYDANGQRVQKTSSSGAVSYVYDLAGHQVAEFNSSGGWNRGEVYAGGRHLATYANSTTYFIHPDWLGTERARSSVSGGLCETITSLPFGDGQSTSGSCSDASPMHFTGKQRDTESNLDYFGARYYSSQFGRFTEPDKLFADQAKPDPQSWNLYAYVRNNPMRFFDPNGFQGEDANASNWDKFKTAVSKLFIAKASVGVGIGAAARVGPVAAKAEAKVEASIGTEKGETKAEVALKVGVAAGKADTMVGPQASIPIVSTTDKGVKWGGEPKVGIVSDEGTGRDHQLKSNAGQSVEGNSEETSIPITISGHFEDVGGEVGIDLAQVPDVFSSGLAALNDGINFLGQLALEKTGLTGSPTGDPAAPGASGGNNPAPAPKPN